MSQFFFRRKNTAEVDKLSLSTTIGTNNNNNNHDINELLSPVPLAQATETMRSSIPEGITPHIKVSITPGGARDHMPNSRGQTIKTMNVLDDSNSNDNDEEEEDDAFPEMEPFDPRKAHEDFIWKALHGKGLIGGDVKDEQGRGKLERMESSMRRLKWADEDGGELNNVQYFDKNAAPSDVLRAMLAADARVEGGESGRAAQGREEIVKNMKPILDQIKGHVKEVEPVRVMRNGETRTVLTAGVGPMTTRVGVAIVWMGGLIQHLKMVKNPDEEFLEDNTEEPIASPEGLVCSPFSSENEFFMLSPPYLVPRPDVFPSPRVIVSVVSAHNLKGSTAIPRPVNPYVKLKLGEAERRTPIVSNTKNPYWGGEDDQSKFYFDAIDPNAILNVTVGDWKMGKNVWIARLAIPLASIEVTMEEEPVLREYELRCRMSRFNKHIEKEGTSNSKLIMRIRYEHMERWWIKQELKARDEASAPMESAEINLGMTPKDLLGSNCTVM